MYVLLDGQILTQYSYAWCFNILKPIYVFVVCATKATFAIYFYCLFAA
jgi:hypothetical protein